MLDAQGYVTIGTDCSGIEAPIEALKQLGIPFRHKWSCEIDKFARKSILANYEPEILYDDITQRDHSKLPDVDIYVCGFPCQSFSLMGKKRGTQDPRSNIMLHCIDVIRSKLPQVFILENVKNFKFIEKGKPYRYLLHELTSIVDAVGDHVYSVYPYIYNTKDYGIPQNRERLYVVGIRQDVQIDEFRKPQSLPMRPLDEFIVDKRINKLRTRDKVLIKNIAVVKNTQNRVNAIVTPFTYFYPLIHVSPTLTTRCASFVHTIYNRTLSAQECLSLQGFNDTFNVVVSKSQICKQAGNSMSVNVIKIILQEILNITLLGDILT